MHLQWRVGGSPIDLETARGTIWSIHVGGFLNMATGATLHRLNDIVTQIIPERICSGIFQGCFRLMRCASISCQQAMDEFR